MFNYLDIPKFHNKMGSCPGKLKQYKQTWLKNYYDSGDK